MNNVFLPLLKHNNNPEIINVSSIEAPGQFNTIFGDFLDCHASRADRL